MTNIVRRSMVGRQGDLNLLPVIMTGLFLPVNTPDLEYLFLP